MAKHVRISFVLKKTLLICLLTYIGICLIMFSCQRYLMYHPWREIQEPQAYGLQNFKVLHLQDTDGVHITAWHHQAAAGYPTLIFFHGNGGNMSTNSRFLQALVIKGFGLLALDYRGYGASDGVPSETGLYQDARTVIAYAHLQLALPYDRMIYYGESLGTGVAVQMATEFSPGAIVLQSPYTSLEDIGKERYPWLPVHFLITDTFDSLSKIGNVHAPLLLMHGELDIVVPISEGKILFAKVNNPKDAIYFPDRGHNDMDISARVKALIEFSHKYQLIK